MFVYSPYASLELQFIRVRYQNI
ncbi:hypothetical protein XIS1_1580018 [Xenorhabdus innexi]|uniref:Uncharacterized protein n=1 Tax=Xenorhabdus innexi TaxID=290109 RepID=A0A1N6MUW7_9GAMM|nr:hypothetical protein XIS1_1580018 [Xenorhabdus innexi]